MGESKDLGFVFTEGQYVWHRLKPFEQGIIISAGAKESEVLWPNSDRSRSVSNLALAGEDTSPPEPRSKPCSIFNHDGWLCANVLFFIAVALLYLTTSSPSPMVNSSQPTSTAEVDSSSK